MGAGLWHLNAGAHGNWRLVFDDEDRRAMLDRMAGALGRAILSWAIEPTHLHTAGEGDRGDLTAALGGALRDYMGWFEDRHGPETIALRGEVHATELPGRLELIRTIDYIHDNPVKAGAVERAIEAPWSSAREFAGLSRAGIADVARAIRVCGKEPRCTRDAPELSDLDTVRTPGITPWELLAAAAQAFALVPADLVSRKRKASIRAARVAYVRLGVLEGYEHEQLAPLLERDRSVISRIGGLSLDDRTLRIVRTLCRDPRLRRHLPLAPTASAPTAPAVFCKRA